MKTEEQIQTKFEAWALLPPVISIEKDGDGEYEDAHARWMYRAFEAGYQKGAWSGAIKMQKQCGIDYDTLAEKDAEIARLRDYIKRSRTYTEKPPKDRGHAMLWNDITLVDSLLKKALEQTQ